MDDTANVRVRWFHLTPGRFVIGLLAVEVLLWLSERFGWLGWHKGYAVLTAVAVVSLAALGMVVCLGVAVVFRRRFQFSLRLLMLMVVTVAVPSSWLAAEMKETKEQRDVVNEIKNVGGAVQYYWEVDASGNRIANAKPSGTERLRNLLGDDFFNNVLNATLNDHAQVERLKPLPKLNELSLQYTQISDAGLVHVARGVLLPRPAT